MRTDVLFGDPLKRATRALTARLKRGGVPLAPALADVFGRALAPAFDRASVKAAADDITAALTLTGARVSKDLVLEAIAAYRGARDWNTLSGLLPAQPEHPRWWRKLTIISGPTASAYNLSFSRALHELAYPRAPKPTAKELGAPVPFDAIPRISWPRQLPLAASDEDDVARRQGFRDAIEDALRTDPDVDLRGAVRDAPDTVDAEPQGEAPDHTGKPAKTVAELLAREATRQPLSVITIEDPIEFIAPRGYEVVVQPDGTPAYFKLPPPIDLAKLPRTLVEDARRGDRVIYFHRGADGVVITNLPLGAIPARLRGGCQNIAEEALLAATLLVDGTLRYAGGPNGEGRDSRLAEHAARFAERYLKPLTQGATLVACTGDEIAGWMRNDGLWWWRHAEDEPGTEYA